MNNDIEYIKINNEDIPIKIVSLKNSKHIKFFIRDNVVKITKPRNCSKAYLNSAIMKNIDIIYETYKKETKYSLKNILDGDLEILYLGEKYLLSLKRALSNNLKIYFDENRIIIEVNEKLSDDEVVKVVKEALKKLFARNLKSLLQKRLDFWSNEMNLKYNGFNVKVLKSKYGSCNIKTHNLNFNINLIFMNYNVIDYIVIHELAHIKYPNHSSNFYEFVEKYIPNYKACKKWLKNNQKYLNLI